MILVGSVIVLLSIRGQLQQTARALPEIKLR
jgi:hypothetical protein